MRRVTVWLAGRWGFVRGCPTKFKLALITPHILPHWFDLRTVHDSWSEFEFNVGSQGM